MAFRLVTLLLAAVIAMTVLVACAGGASPTPTSPFSLTPTPTPARATPTPTDEPTPTATMAPIAEMFRGVSLSPLSYEGADFTAFLDLAAELDVLRWAGGWLDLQSPSSAAVVVATLAGQYDFDALVATGVFSADDGALFAPLTEENQTAFVETVTSLVTDHPVPYLSLGVEINTHHEADPESFEIYVSLFDRAYDAVKAASPDTQVFVTFQLERLKGLRGGLFGGANDPSQSSWELIDLFPKADLIAFTTYPGLIYPDPADIPDHYYAEIADHTDKPVAFTEVGWTSGTVAEWWESDEAEQVRFIERFEELTAPLEPTMAVWFWLFPQPGEFPLPFQGMTLFDGDGSAKAGWEAWRDG